MTSDDVPKANLVGEENVSADRRAELIKIEAIARTLITAGKPYLEDEDIHLAMYAEALGVTVSNFFRAIAISCGADIANNLFAWFLPYFAEETKQGINKGALIKSQREGTS